MRLLYMVQHSPSECFYDILMLIGDFLKVQSSYRSWFLHHRGFAMLSHLLASFNAPLPNEVVSAVFHISHSCSLDRGLFSACVQDLVFVETTWNWVQDKQSVYTSMTVMNSMHVEWMRVECGVSRLLEGVYVGSNGEGVFVDDILKSWFTLVVKTGEFR